VGGRGVQVRVLQASKKKKNEKMKSIALCHTLLGSHKHNLSIHITACASIYASNTTEFNP